MKSMNFGIKGETISKLCGVPRRSTVPRCYLFSHKQWEHDSDTLLNQIGREFHQCDQIIVRSSASDEDQESGTLAGKFASVAELCPTDSPSVFDAINTVFRSYLDKQGKIRSNDLILVQEYISNVQISGVALSRELNTGAPYYVINYDDQSNRTDTVTGGGAYSNRTLYLHRGATKRVRSPRFRSLLDAMLELEAIFKSDKLDIEFAIDQNMLVYIFQVRPISNSNRWKPGVVERVDNLLLGTNDFLRKLHKPICGVYGNRSILGQMPDWNPAEMIGEYPRPLARSLYQYLITDRAWRIARSRMGYAVPQGRALMISLYGRPYIDVRLSFNSLIPARLPIPIAEQIVTHWLDILEDRPELHDKVEFEIAITCLTFDFEERAKRQLPSSLACAELNQFKTGLANLTNDLVAGHTAPIRVELRKIEELVTRRKALYEKEECKSLTTVVSLLDDCIAFGTVPFSILARHAFIAQSMLRSLVTHSVLSAGQAEKFETSIRTVTSTMIGDCGRYFRGEISKEEFFSYYGHLRPGSYDILSARYDQRTGFF